MRLLSLLAILITYAPAYAKYTVCTATINSSDEREVFKARLNPRDFDFVELTDYKDPSGENSETTWFTKACDAGVKCDVLVVSGHFGGSFFGQTKLTLGLKELEQRSCDNRCDGVIGHLKETYLMGCNTLASKVKDARTPEQYLAVLVHDGIARADAERVVAARYGPFGSSFADRMERAFEGTPIIYGFSSVGPSGANVKKSLGAFLERLGDYKTHLDKMDVASARATWLDVMKPYNRATGAGLLKSNPAYVIKKNSCELGDDKRPIDQRVALAERLLDENHLLYLPVVSSFFTAAVKPNGYVAGGYMTEMERQTLSRLRNRSDLAEVFRSARESDGTTPSLKVDLLKTERNIGWLSAWEYGTRMRALFGKYTAAPDQEGADFICSQISEDPLSKKFVSLADLNGYAFSGVAQYHVAGCVDIKDASITRRALDAYES